MTLNEFENNHYRLNVGDQPLYVFLAIEEDVFEYSSWSEACKNCNLLCTLESDYKPSTYLNPKYSEANVLCWGLVDGRLCACIDV